MRLLAALAPLLLLAAALAGCTAKPAEPQAAPAKPEEPQAGLVKSSDVANLSQGDDQSAFAKSLDDKFHTHDYWGGGALEKTLLDADIASGPVVREDNTFGPTSIIFANLIFFGIAGGVGFTPFELPVGTIVPPEANKLDVTVTWADSPTITGLKLGYRDATPQGFRWIGQVESGKTLSIATNLSANDIPHTDYSKWRFALGPYNPQNSDAPGVFNGTAHVTIKAYRNDTLYVAPPHPDFWRENTTLHLMTNTSKLQATMLLFPISADTSGGAQSGVFMQLPPGTIVPPHTKDLTLTLTWNNTSPVPDATDLRPDIIWFTANSGAPQHQASPTVQGNKAVFVVPVTAKQVDSPYANESAWGFFVYLHSDTDQGFGFGSVGDFNGDVTLNVDAERDG
jgi:hypothetical protein